MYHVTSNYPCIVTYDVTVILVSPHVSLGNKSVMIYLPINLVRESRRYGLNISGISRNALRDSISRLEGSYCSQPECFKQVLVRPPGFGPGLEAWEACGETCRSSPS
jgi:hypothetical protein